MDLLYLAYYLSWFLTPITIIIILYKISHSSKRGMYVYKNIINILMIIIYTWLSSVEYNFLKAVYAKFYVKKYQRHWAENLKGVSDDVLEHPKANLTEDVRKH